MEYIISGRITKPISNNLILKDSIGAQGVLGHSALGIGRQLEMLNVFIGIRQLINAYLKVTSRLTSTRSKT
jgi:hypothetical protein